MISKFNVVDKVFGFRKVNDKFVKIVIRITYLNDKAINFQMI